MDDAGSQELIVNEQLADLLRNHGLRVSVGDEFVSTDLSDDLKFKARVVYHEINGSISSRLDVMAATNRGEHIIECFGDFGSTLGDATTKNFRNFSLSSLHTILAAFGSRDHETLRQVEIEEWVLDGKTWKVYLGNLVPKTMAGARYTPPPEFFQSVEQAVRRQKLPNRLHWFRSYYYQFDTDIQEREFLMDNEPKDADSIFADLPVLPNVKFFSCRNFILLREK
ncbi:MAG: DUF6348 family protein [Chryseolinea sp.]